MWDLSAIFNEYEYHVIVRFVLGETQMAEYAVEWFEKGYDVTCINPGPTALKDSIDHKDWPTGSYYGLYATAKMKPLITRQVLEEKLNAWQSAEPAIYILHHNSKTNQYVFFANMRAKNILENIDIPSNSLDDLLKAVSGLIEVKKETNNKQWQEDRSRPKVCKPHKICGCFTSYRRPQHLMRQIYTFMAMREKNFHLACAVKGISEYDVKTLIIPYVQQYIDEGRLTIKVFPNRAQLWNHIDAFTTAGLDNFDYFCKLDDDDFYSPDYMTQLVQFHARFPKELGGSIHRGYIGTLYPNCNKVTQWMLHNNNSYRGNIGNTMVFSRENVKRFIEISQDPDRFHPQGWVIANEDNIFLGMLYYTSFANRAAFDYKRANQPIVIINRSEPSTSFAPNGNTSYMINVYKHGVSRPVGYYGLGNEWFLRVKSNTWDDTVQVMNRHVVRGDNTDFGEIKLFDENVIAIHWPAWHTTEIFVKRDDGAYHYDPNYDINEVSDSDNS